MNGEISMDEVRANPYQRIDLNALSSHPELTSADFLDLNFTNVSRDWNMAELTRIFPIDFIIENLQFRWSEWDFMRKSDLTIDALGKYMVRTKLTIFDVIKQYKGQLPVSLLPKIAEKWGVSMAGDRHRKYSSIHDIEMAIRERLARDSREELITRSIDNMEIDTAHELFAYPSYILWSLVHPHASIADYQYALEISPNDTIRQQVMRTASTYFPLDVIRANPQLPWNNEKVAERMRHRSTPRY